jgi:hypothetical protein
MKIHFYHVMVVLLLFTAVALQAQVLGSCAQSDSPEVQEAASSPASEMMVDKIPLPGEPAIDFELTAVVGDEIKQIKLSDYQGKWRLVCFFPAAFTFV